MELVYCSGRGMRAQSILDDANAVPILLGAEKAPMSPLITTDCLILDLELDRVGSLTVAELTSWMARSVVTPD
jgi:hypothetical protein